MAINTGGLTAIIICCVLLFIIVRVWAFWNGRSKKQDTDETMLAGRSLGSFVGVLTLTATWVGGGYIIGSAEAEYESGLVWCQAPFAYSISLAIGGIFFAKKMRDAGYVDMLDPFQNLFGRWWGSMLFFPALAGEILWFAATLAALGSILTVTLDLNLTNGILISGSTSYIMFKALPPFVYADVIQLFCIFIGLWIAVPFAAHHEAVSSLEFNSDRWIGSIDTSSYELGEWFDYLFLLIFGGIPWQVYFQRVHSARSSRQAQVLSLAAALGCIIMAVPAVVIGVIGKETNWNATSFNRAIGDEEKSLILPLVIHYLTPKWIYYLGIGAVSAAMILTADSSFLSSSLVLLNLYKYVFRAGASEKELKIVFKFLAIGVLALSGYTAIVVKSVKVLFYLCSDIVYVMLFPQLTLAVHAPNYINIYGSIPAYFVGFLLRILGGEVSLGIPAVIKYPWYDEAQNRQLFPFRTLSMLVTFVILLVFSWLGKKIFHKGYEINISHAISSNSITSETKFGIENHEMLNSDQSQTELHSCPQTDEQFPNSR